MVSSLLSVKFVNGCGTSSPDSLSTVSQGDKDTNDHTAWLRGERRVPARAQQERGRLAARGDVCGSQAGFKRWQLPDDTITDRGGKGEERRGRRMARELLILVRSQIRGEPI